MRDGVGLALLSGRVAVGPLQARHRTLSWLCAVERARTWLARLLHTLEHEVARGRGDAQEVRIVVAPVRVGLERRKTLCASGRVVRASAASGRRHVLLHGRGEGRDAAGGAEREPGRRAARRRAVAHRVREVRRERRVRQRDAAAGSARRAGSARGASSAPRTARAPPSCTRGAVRRCPAAPREHNRQTQYAEATHRTSVVPAARTGYLVVAPPGSHRRYSRVAPCRRRPRDNSARATIESRMSAFDDAPEPPDMPSSSSSHAHRVPDGPV